MACDAQSLIDAAYASGYAKLSWRDLMEATVAAACAGGGGGGSGCIISGTWPPAANPPASCTAALFYSTDANPGVALWNGAAWVNIIDPGP